MKDDLPFYNLNHQTFKLAGKSASANFNTGVYTF